MEKLDCKSLMIGDWVYCKPHKKYAKVYRIDQANGEGNGWIAAIDGDYSEDRYEPIPLKRIHLTKNGFKVMDTEDTTFVYRDGYKIEVIFSSNPNDPLINLSIEFAEKEVCSRVCLPFGTSVFTITRWYRSKSTALAPATTWITCQGWIISAPCR